MLGFVRQWSVSHLEHAGSSVISPFSGNRSVPTSFTDVTLVAMLSHPPATMKGIEKFKAYRRYLRLSS